MITLRISIVTGYVSSFSAKNISQEVKNAPETPATLSVSKTINVCANGSMAGSGIICEPIIFPLLPELRLVVFTIAFLVDIIVSCCVSNKPFAEYVASAKVSLATISFDPSPTCLLFGSAVITNSISPVEN